MSTLILFAANAHRLWTICLFSVLIVISLIEIILSRQERFSRQKMMDRLSAGILLIDPKNEPVYLNRTVIRFLRQNGIRYRERSEELNRILESHFKSVSPDEPVSYLYSERIFGTVLDVMIIRIHSGERLILLTESDQRIRQWRQLWNDRHMEAIKIMADGFAHDFNNLLTAIMGNLEVTQFVDDAKKKNDLIEASREASLMASDLVKQILIFTGNADYKTRRLNFEEVLNRIIKMSARNVPEEVEMVPNIRTEDTAVNADPNQLMRIFLNLIINARDAVLEGYHCQRKNHYNGRIEIFTDLLYIDTNDMEKFGMNQAGNYIRTIIKDNGCGIDPETQIKIFDPFFTTKPQVSKKGSGMGLSMVYGDLKRINGAIEIISSIDSGTECQVFLPVIQEKASNKSNS